MTNDTAPVDLRAAPKIIRDLQICGYIFAASKVARFVVEIEALRARVTALEASIEDRRDEITAAYHAGAVDVHTAWTSGKQSREPDFTEAASDYASQQEWPMTNDVLAERARIVAWLRQQRHDWCPDPSYKAGLDSAIQAASDAIERGEHCPVKESPLEPAGYGWANAANIDSGSAKDCVIKRMKDAQYAVIQVQRWVGANNFIGIQIDTPPNNNGFHGLVAWAQTECLLMTRDEALAAIAASAPEPSR